MTDSVFVFDKRCHVRNVTQEMQSPWTRGTWQRTFLILKRDSTATARPRSRAGEVLHNTNALVEVPLF